MQSEAKIIEQVLSETPAVNLSVNKKRCTKCGKYKKLYEFYKGSLNKGGFRTKCKACHHSYRMANKKHKADYQNRYNKTLPGYLRKLWYGIRRRCNNPKVSSYKNYGGRGIRNKFNNFKEFYQYIVNELCVDPRGLTIDRIDNDGHYEKGNIRFVSKSENSKNKRKKYAKRKHN